MSIGKTYQVHAVAYIDIHVKTYQVHAVAYIDTHVVPVHSENERQACTRIVQPSVLIKLLLSGLVQRLSGLLATIIVLY